MNILITILLSIIALAVLPFAIYITFGLLVMLFGLGVYITSAVLSSFIVLVEWTCEIIYNIVNKIRRKR